MYELKCTRCEAPVEHTCSTGGDRHPNRLVSALIDLLVWKPEGGLPDAVVSAMRKSGWYDEGDEDRPFFTQSVIYPLLGGKHEGRSFFGYLHEVIRAAGLDVAGVRSLARKARVVEQVNVARRTGGILRGHDLAHVHLVGDIIPAVGWEVALVTRGVGQVVSPIVRVEREERGGSRRDAYWVGFPGSGEVSFRRILRIAVWIKNEKGEVVWPIDPPQQEVESE